MGLVEPLHKSQGLLGCWKRDEHDDLDRLNDAGDVDLIIGTFPKEAILMVSHSGRLVGFTQQQLVGWTRKI